MCVIIVKKGPTKLNEDIALQALSYNPDGFGIQMLDDGQVYKTMDIKEAQEWLASERPYIFHARLTTVGKTSLENVHPVQVNEHNWLFHNGTVQVPHTWDKTSSDTRFVADTLRKTPWQSWKDILSMTVSRFAYTRKSKAGKMYVNRIGDWHEKDKVYYSKSNVLDKPHLIAVYGTLRQGYHNHRLLNTATLVAAGNTLRDLRMVCEGIPYVLPPEEDGVGYRIAVEVYAVDDKTLARVDALEGHPRWYVREKTPIVLDNGLSTEAWLYFNPVTKDSGKYYSDFAQYSKPKTTSLERYSMFDEVEEQESYQPSDFLWDENEKQWFNQGDDCYWSEEDKEAYLELQLQPQLSLFE
jgi:gamma-glutamylcyclotransferase (GGCT)/AIG2-like uncharacterized protein YtfP